MKGTEPKWSANKIENGTENSREKCGKLRLR